jgi:hypothetical protein
MKQKAAEDRAICLANIAHVRRIEAEQKKEVRRQEFVRSVGDRSLGLRIVASAEHWANGRQHLGDRFYICSDCREIKEDPADFSIIYAAGKQPLFNGLTKCNYCFHQSIAQ